MKRALLVAMAILLVLSSCAVYRVGQGKSQINEPEKVTVPETRYRVIVEQGLDVKKYLTNPTFTSFPYYYDIEDGNAVKGDNDILSAVFFHLEDKMDESEVRNVISSIGNLNPDFMIITGPAEDTFVFARVLKKNALLFEKGAVISSFNLSGSDSDEGLFEINSRKGVSIAVNDISSPLPENPDEYLSFLEGKEKSMDAPSRGLSSAAIYALSSDEPGFGDWTSFTGFGYRNARTFPLANDFVTKGWKDIWRESHYNGDTDSGCTRENGEIAERLEQVYFKGMMPVKSLTFDLVGKTGKALYFEFMLP